MSQQLHMFPQPTPMANGGGYEGAERLSRDVGTWYARRGSADQQILPQKDESDARHNDVMRNDAYAVGALQKFQDSIVGPQFRLNCTPQYRALGPQFDEVWLKEFQEEVENKFPLWAESSNCWVDAAGVNTFTELCRLVIGPLYMVYGEWVATGEWIRDGRTYNTAIQMIDPERLCNPYNVPETTFFRGGVEKNRWGRPIRYHFRNTHPYDYVNELRDTRFRAVPAYKPWGRKQVIHYVEQGRIGQTRGIGKMVSALKESRMRSKLSDIELQNVVLNAVYAAVLETDLPPEIAVALVGGSADGVIDADNDAYQTLVAQVHNYFGGKNLYLDSAKMPVLPPGVKMNMQRTTSEANPQFSFEKSLNRYIARAFGLSYEEFTGDFTETSYSSARASLGESWKLYQSKRKMVVGRFATEVYSLWLEEAISKGFITSLPAGFGVVQFNEGMTKDALTKCRWLGAPKSIIDPEKEAKAHRLNLSINRTTLEDVCSEDGKDWRDVLDQRAREEQYAESLGITLAYNDANPGAADSNAMTDPDREPNDMENEDEDGSGSGS